MSGTCPSLINMPGDILKEIVETVARISVSNRGADNAICSLSMVNKRFYDLAIPHIFRAIRIRRLWHFSLNERYTEFPPAALKHTRYLGLEFPPDYVLNAEIKLLCSTAYVRRWIATQLLATLQVAENAQVVSIEVPQGILYYLKSHADVPVKKFASVVELHYYPHLGEKTLDSGIPKLFPNLTTLVGFGINMYIDLGLVNNVVIPFLRAVFSDHEHLQHLQLHVEWQAALLPKLARIAPRLETIAMGWSMHLLHNFYLSHCTTDKVERLRRVLEESKSMKNITLPRYNSPGDEVVFKNVLGMIQVDYPHIAIVATDLGMEYELWRRSSNFQIRELVPKSNTTATTNVRKSQFWMRYLEPVAPHQKVIVTSGGNMKVITINPIFETEVVG